MSAGQKGLSKKSIAVQVPELLVQHRTLLRAWQQFLVKGQSESQMKRWNASVSFKNVNQKRAEMTTDE
jgi:hypothetical protein